MKKEHAEKLIEFFENDYDIFYLADTDDHYGWVVADGIDKNELSIGFDIVDFFVPLQDKRYNINDFKVYKEVKDWWKA